MASINAMLGNLVPTMQSALTYTFALKMVEDKMNTGVVDNTLLTIMFVVFALGIVIVLKQYLDAAITDIEARRKKTDGTPAPPNLGEVLLVPAKMLNYMLKDGLIILVQTFSVLIATEIMAIQPSGEVTLLYRLLMVLTVLAYYWLLLYAVKIEG